MSYKLQLSMIKHLRYSFDHTRLDLKTSIKDWLYEQRIAYEFSCQVTESEGESGTIRTNRWFIEFENNSDAVAFKLVWL
jgi:hypothetical protein